MTQFFNRTTEKSKRRQLRKNMTKAEVMIWSQLRRKQIEGCKFRRQYSVDSYVIDFYCPALKFAIEIDGDTHFQEEAAVYDRERQASIERFGIRFLRFTNQQIYHDLEGVLRIIRNTIKQMEQDSSNLP